MANNNGFTLADLFSYCEKHNEANGEENTDGSNYNFSINVAQRVKLQEVCEGTSKKTLIYGVVHGVFCTGSAAAPCRG